MLAIQVAMGIVLAYIIIVNQRALLRFGKSTALIIAFIAVGAFLIYLTSATYQAVALAVSPSVGRIVGNLGNIAVGFVFIILAGISGHGLSALFYRVRHRQPPEDYSDNFLIFWSFSNILIVFFVGYVLSLTPLVDLYNKIDEWSRSYGYSDLGTMTIYLFSLPWPFLPLWILNRLIQNTEEGLQ